MRENTGLTYLRNRYYDEETGTFMTLDPIKDGLNWYAYCAGNPVMFVDPWGLEDIVVSGGMYATGDSWPYEFIEPALNKIWEWKANNPDEEITWIIAMAGWTDEDIDDFKSAVQGVEEINVIAINDIDELINYINSKDILSNQLTVARREDQITKFALFSHGLANNGGTIELGYGFENAAHLQITTSDIQKINSSAFASGNRSAFYSCNTGTAGQNSFAQVWADKTNGNTWAFVEKSNYSGAALFDGQSLEIKIKRYLGGFYWGGSWGLPVAGTDKVPSGPWKGEVPFFKLFS